VRFIFLTCLHSEIAIADCLRKKLLCYITLKQSMQSWEMNSSTDGSFILFLAAVPNYALIGNSKRHDSMHRISWL